MTEDARSRVGSPDDRKMSTAGAVSTGAAAGLVIGLCDWVFLQCYTNGHWHFAPPSASLIEVGAPILILPLGLWLGKVFELIGKIITNRLEKDAQ